MFRNDEDTEGITPAQLIAKYQAVPDSSTPTSLAGLDAINWSALHHAYGEARDVPALLRAALSDDERDRRFAFILLHETIWHQGTVYEASSAVVPFLLKMLESPTTPDTPSVVLLLTSLADGHSYLEDHAYSDKKREATWRSLLAKKGRELEAEAAVEMGWVNAARRAVGQGVHLLYPYLEDSTLSGDVATALALYPERASETLPLLANALASVKDKYAREAIQTAIAKLTGADGQ